MNSNRNITEGFGEWCGLSKEHISSLTPNLSKLRAVRIDTRTVVYFNQKRRTEAEIIEKFKKYTNHEKEKKNGG